MIHIKTREFKPRKYCTYHKSKSHSTEECREHQKQSNKYNQHHNNRRNTNKSIIKIPENDELCPNINLTINKHRLNAIIDTGSSKNYISSKTSNKLKLNPSKKHKGYLVEIGNGSKIQIEKEVQVDFHIENNSANINRTTFDIMPSQTESIILGMQFLREKETTINLKSNFITINNREFELNNPTNNLDMKLYE